LQSRNTLYPSEIIIMDYIWKELFGRDKKCRPTGPQIQKARFQNKIKGQAQIRIKVKLSPFKAPIQLTLPH